MIVTQQLEPRQDFKIPNPFQFLISNYTFPATSLFIPSQTQVIAYLSTHRGEAFYGVSRVPLDSLMTEGF